MLMYECVRHLHSFFPIIIPFSFIYKYTNIFFRHFSSLLFLIHLASPSVLLYYATITIVYYYKYTLHYTSDGWDVSHSNFSILLLIYDLLARSRFIHKKMVSHC